MLKTSFFVLILAAWAFAPSSQSWAAERSVPSWMKWQAGKTKVTFTMKAAYNGNNGSWNWNGYSDGGATVVVPLGSTVIIKFVNPDGNYAHSVLVAEPFAPEDYPDSAGRKHVAIPRAYSRSPADGCLSCKEDLRFKAKKAGKYYLWCGVLGHGPAGMWIRFEVSAEAEAPYVLIADDAIAADDQPPWQ